MHMSRVSGLSNGRVAPLLPIDGRHDCWQDKHLHASMVSHIQCEVRQDLYSSAQPCRDC